MATVNPLRITQINSGDENPQGRYVLYWMIANRRPHYNFALQHAVATARRLGKPLVVLEALRVGYRWASDRHHAFIIDGMADNQQSFAQGPVTYYPYVEPTPGAGSGLLAALAADACSVVTDDYPAFFLSRMVQAAGSRLSVRLEAVDSNGLLPMAVANRAHLTAYAFRRFLQQELPDHLDEFPVAYPLKGARLSGRARIRQEIRKRWPTVPDLPRVDLSRLPIDHSVGGTGIRGGRRAGLERLDAFLDTALPRYAEGSKRTDDTGTSHLSPYLHYGHVSTHEIVARLFQRESWSPEKLARRANGKRQGWWGLSEPLEAFLDQLVTWRELGFNACRFRPDYDKYESLPPWAQETLDQHADDPRPHAYSLEQFEQAKTHDPLWNAAQRQLVREGRIHNYLRMLWGKKILHWSRSPRTALQVMLELNNKYALDGRDPNSYSGIFWVLGRYDRPWGPEREIFGKIRYMTSENTARKFDVKPYLARYGVEGA